MAFIKEEMTQFGISASYWKLARITCDRIAKEGSYSLYLYFSKDAETHMAERVVSLNEMDDKTRYEAIFESGGDVVENCYLDAAANEDYWMDAINDEITIDMTEGGE